MTERTEGRFVGAALDTETTGLDSSVDQIIEIGIQLFRFELPSGRVTERLEHFDALQDPGFPIPPKIQLVTGITNPMLVGQRIDWDAVDRLLDRADMILAHNAAFDRGFVDRKSRVSPGKLWACTASQVEWRGKGFRNAKLQDLCGALGVTYSPHRAMSDVGAMLQLIGLEDVFTGKPYLAELVESARREMAWVWVEGLPREANDQVKRLGFAWNGASKAWVKLVEPGQEQAQIELIQALFPGVSARSRLVAPKDRFKSL